MNGLFLTSLADLMDRRIANGSAVHVTAETARELRALAVLPWESAKYERILRQGAHVLGDVSAQRLSVDETVTPADLALGWLLASNAQPICVTDDWHERVDRARRAAICAELAVIAPLALPMMFIEISMPFSDEHRKDARKVRDAYGLGVLPVIDTGIAKRQWSAADGTREGARAAWRFIMDTLEAVTTAPYVVFDRAKTSERDIAESQKNYQATAQMYRGELEAMP